MPQWSPAAKAGNTRSRRPQYLAEDTASMEPGRKGREYGQGAYGVGGGAAASMDPGRKGREYGSPAFEIPQICEEPQWSPAAKAGNTTRK